MHLGLRTKIKIHFKEFYTSFRVPPEKAAGLKMYSTTETFCIRRFFWWNVKNGFQTSLKSEFGVSTTSLTSASMITRTVQ